MAASRTTPQARRPVQQPALGIVVAVVAVLVAAIAPGATAGAARQDTQTSVGNDDRTIYVTLDGSRSSAVVGVATPPAWALECSVGTGTYEYVWVIYHSSVPASPEDLSGLPPEELEEEWAYLRCPPNDYTIAINPLIETSHMLSMWPIDGSPPAEVIDIVVQQAIGSVELPATAGVSAPFGDDLAPMITQLDTWLWVDDATWQARTASAGPIFGVTATAVATPVHVEWTAGDDHADCGANTGPVYDFGRPDAAQHSDCVVAYRHSSVVDDATLTAAITWRVTYSCSVPCGSGVYGDLVVITERPVRVAELLAVGTSSAPQRTEGPRG